MLRSAGASAGTSMTARIACTGSLIATPPSRRRSQIVVSGPDRGSSVAAASGNSSARPSRELILLDKSRFLAGDREAVQPIDGGDDRRLIDHCRIILDHRRPGRVLNKGHLAATDPG